MTLRAAQAMTGGGAVARPALRDLVRYFLWLGAFGFGGPIALAGDMERRLVHERGWVTAPEFADGLAFAQLAPGPLAAQLAMYFGWLCAGVRGATLISAAFIGPSFVMVLGLSALYVRFSGLPWLQAVFYGVGAAVIAIIARSAVKLARATLSRDRLLWVLFATSVLVTAWTESEIVWVFLASGVIALAAKAPPRFIARGAASLALPVSSWMSPPFVGGLVASAQAGVLWTILLYFASAGLFVFGSGLAIVPFLHGGVVQRFGWLTERQFLDAVAVSMVTPGPVVITVAFIGYLVAGPLGATVAAIGVFAPVYGITIVLAPFYQRFAANRQVHAFVQGVTAAAVGAIGGAVFVLGRRAIIDVPTALIAAGTIAVLLGTRRIPEPLVIVAAGLVGFVVATAAV